MPFITVEILQGRSTEQRRRFAQEVTKAAVVCLDAKPENVRIRFIDIDPAYLARSGKLASDGASAPE